MLLEADLSVVGAEEVRFVREKMTWWWRATTGSGCVAYATRSRARGAFSVGPRRQPEW